MPKTPSATLRLLKAAAEAPRPQDAACVCSAAGLDTAASSELLLRATHNMSRLAAQELSSAEASAVMSSRAYKMLTCASMLSDKLWSGEWLSMPLTPAKRSNMAGGRVVCDVRSRYFPPCWTVIHLRNACNVRTVAAALRLLHALPAEYLETAAVFATTLAQRLHPCAAQAAQACAKGQADSIAANACLNMLACLQFLMQAAADMCWRLEDDPQPFCGAPGVRFLAAAPAMANAVLTMPALPDAGLAGLQERAVECALQLLGPLHLVVRNAGASGRGHASWQAARTPTLWESLLQYLQHTLVLLAAAEHQQARGRCSWLPADAAAAAGGHSPAGRGDSLAVPALHSALLHQLPAAGRLLQGSMLVLPLLLNRGRAATAFNAAMDLLQGGLDALAHGAHLVRSVTPAGMSALLRVVVEAALLLSAAEGNFAVAGAAIVHYGVLCVLAATSCDGTSGGAAAAAPAGPDAAASPVPAPAALAEAAARLVRPVLYLLSAAVLYESSQELARARLAAPGARSHAQPASCGHSCGPYTDAVAVLVDHGERPPEVGCARVARACARQHVLQCVSAGGTCQLLLRPRRSLPPQRSACCASGLQPAGSRHCAAAAAEPGSSGGGSQGARLQQLCAPRRRLAPRLGDC
jgi:hypothetical protein